MLQSEEFLSRMNGAKHCGKVAWTILWQKEANSFLPNQSPLSKVKNDERHATSYRRTRSSDENQCNTNTHLEHIRK